MPAGPTRDASQSCNPRNSDSTDVRALLNRLFVCCCAVGHDVAREACLNRSGVAPVPVPDRRHCVRSVDSEVSDHLDSDASPEDAVSDGVNAVSALSAQHAFGSSLSIRRDACHTFLRP